MIFVCMYVRVYMCMCMPMYVYVYVCVGMYVYGWGCMSVPPCACGHIRSFPDRTF